jgi:hypothetical protein
VIPTLQADGHEVIAVQYGLNSYADGIEPVKRTLGRRSGVAKAIALRGRNSTTLPGKLSNAWLNGFN